MRAGRTGRHDVDAAQRPQRRQRIGRIGLAATNAGAHAAAVVAFILRRLIGHVRPPIEAENMRESRQAQ